MADRKVATLEQVVSLARQIPPVEKIRLTWKWKRLERMVPEIERDMLGQRPPRRKSLLGLCADLGPAPSAEDIVEVRREMWADFPREDIGQL